MAIVLRDNQVVLTGVFTVSDAGGVAAGDILRINGANTVTRCTAADDGAIGVARAAAANGAAVDVVLQGVVTMTADGAISAGAGIGPTTTAGRVVSRGLQVGGVKTNTLGIKTSVCGSAACDGQNLGEASQYDNFTAKTNAYGRAINDAAGAGSTFSALIGFS